MSNNNNDPFNKKTSQGNQTSKSTSDKRKLTVSPAYPKSFSGEMVKRPVRLENFDERLSRLHYQYDDGPKPAHFDDPKIIDTENYGKRPKPFNNADKSTYPSDRNQQQKMSTWDIILDSTIKSGTPEEKKQIRDKLREEYKKYGKEHLTIKEQKFISVYKYPEPTFPKVEVPSVQVKKPIIQKAETDYGEHTDIETLIKERSKKRLQQEQQQYDDTVGTGGITTITRPK